MGTDTAIEWCDHTFNPWLGCTKVSPACDHCYAESWARRTGQAALWQGERRQTSAANWRQPLRWNRAAEAAGVRRRVFCASLADVFDNQVDGSDWLEQLWTLIRATPSLDWLLLTKRPQNMRARMPDDWGRGWSNVWLGTTVENQTEADRRIPALLSVPAKLHFLSCEPLLGAVDLTRICLVPKKPGSARAGVHVDALRGRYVESGLAYIGDWDINGPYPTDAAVRRIGWVIAGGESGADSRPMHVDWARGLRDQCVEAGVPFFFKQWGDWLPGTQYQDEHSDADPGDFSRFATMDWDSDFSRWVHADGEWGCDMSGDEVHRVGKRRAGAVLDDAEHRAFPNA